MTKAPMPRRFPTAITPIITPASSIRAISACCRACPGIYDEPFGDISALPTFAVCKLARQSVKAALTGDGGDEILGGYRRYAFFASQMRARRWLPDKLRGPLFSLLADIYPHGARLPRMLRAKTTFRELSLSAADAYLRMVSALPEEIRAQFLSRDFRSGLGGYDSGDVVRQHFNVDAPLDMLQRAQYADIMTYLPGDILTKVDRASMANSLELRAPFLDQELSDWAFSLPDDLKLRRGAGGKAVLKKAMEEFLPHDLLYRSKKGSPFRSPNGFAARSARMSGRWRMARTSRTAAFSIPPRLKKWRRPISAAAAIFPSRSGCCGCSEVFSSTRLRQAETWVRKSDQSDCDVEHGPADHRNRRPDDQANAERHSVALIHYFFLGNCVAAGRPCCRELDNFAFCRALSHVTSAFVVRPVTRRSTGIV